MLNRRERFVEEQGLRGAETIPANSEGRGLRYWLFRHESSLVTACEMVLLLVIIGRLTIAARTSFFTDTRVFVATADLVREGLSPYDPNVYMPRFGMSSPGAMSHIQSPGMSILAMPLCFLCRPAQYAVMFALGVIAFYAFVLTVFGYYGFDCRVGLKPRWRNLPFMLVLTCICISSPLLGMLRAGQNSSMAAFLLFLVLLFPRRKSNACWLALAATVKYSMMTFLAPVLILQRRWLVSIVSFLIFVLIMLALGFWVDGVIPMLRDYVTCVMDSTIHGGNSYGTGSFFFLNIGFIKNAAVNFCLKAAVCLLYVGAVAKIWSDRERRKGLAFPLRLTAAEWGLFAAMTVTVSYHRIQDGVLFMPFLGCIFLDQVYRSGRGEAKTLTSFLKMTGALALVVFWIIPSSVVFRVSSWIGHHFPQGESYVHYFTDSLAGCSKIFPVLQCAMLLMTCFLAWLVFTQNPRHLK